MITQAKLARFRELQEEANRIANEAYGLRQEILAANEAKEPWEPGPLGPVINTFPRRAVSWAKLTEAIGREKVNDLMALIAPTTVTTLKVEEL